MKKVESINKGKFLGAYIDAQNSEWFPDETYFLAAVVILMVLPRIIYCVYGGPIPLIAFVSSALAGLVFGLASYYYQPPSQTISCVSMGTVPQAPPGEDSKPKAA